MAPRVSPNVQMSVETLLAFVLTGEMQKIPKDFQTLCTEMNISYACEGKARDRQCQAQI